MTRADRLFDALSALLVAVLLALMLATFLDYGITVDEPVQNRYGNRLLRWYHTFGADRAAVEQNDTAYYGGLFELAAKGAEAVSPLGLYETRHLVNALVGFTGVLAALWMGRRLAGPAGGLLATVMIAATPAFYGQCFNNPKDLPFASLWALAAAALMSLGLDRLPGPGWRVLARLLGAGALVGLAAAVRVAGLALLGFAGLAWLVSLWAERRRVVHPSRPLWRDLGRVFLDLAIVTSTAWLVMVLFWPYAQLDPFGNPFEAFHAFSHYWNPVAVEYAGVLTTSDEVGRFYMPRLFAITLPESYLVAAVMGLWRVATVLRHAPLPEETWSKLHHFGWLLTVTLLPLLWAVVAGTPFYNGSRHLLFVVPGLAALAGVSAAWWLRSPLPVAARATGALLLAGTVFLTVRDMAELHPYESVYFNRLLGGGLARAGRLYDTDYWCQSYKDGIDWIVREYSRPGLERVKVAGHSVLPQIAYYLEKDEVLRRRFKAVTGNDQPHLVLATTSTHDDQRTPGRVVHVVERQGLPLLKVFEVRPPGPAEPTTEPVAPPAEPTAGR
ncbi:MAG TPA: hypothetical protein VEQ10_21355 [Vicinamibacteria bacterium]|nr:hypothetical protein [Vicinamibacteria bacterium]